MDGAPTKEKAKEQSAKAGMVLAYSRSMTLVNISAEAQKKIMMKLGLSSTQGAKYQISHWCEISIHFVKASSYGV